LQRIERMLGALLVALAVNEGLADAMGHAAENFKRRGRRFRIEELARPRRQLAVGIGILRRDELNEVGKLLVVVEEGIEIGLVIRRQREFFGRAMVDRRSGGDGERLRALVKIRDRHAVAKHVVDPAEPHRRRHDVEAAFEHAQIVAVAGAQHDAVFAKRHRARVAVFGLVMDGQQRHRRGNHRHSGQFNL